MFMAMVWGGLQEEQRASLRNVSQYLLSAEEMDLGDTRPRRAPWSLQRDESQGSWNSYSRPAGPWEVMPQGYLSQDTHRGGLLPSPLRDTWAGGSHCEIQTRGEFQLLKNLAKQEEEQMTLQAAGRALQAGMLQEEGKLLCQMQTSRCEKSGCAGGKKDFASHSVSSKASQLPLLMPPAQRDSPAWLHCWVG